MRGFFDSVRQKYHNKNKILFNQDTPGIEMLTEEILNQDKSIVLNWVFDCVKNTVEMYDLLSGGDKLPQEMIVSCEAWVKGEIKFPIVKKKILEVHNIAKGTDDIVIQSLVHAIAQAGSTIHVKTHALGLVYYELTALVFLNGIDAFEDEVSSKMDFYRRRLEYWESKDQQKNLQQSQI